MKNNVVIYGTGQIIKLFEFVVLYILENTYYICLSPHTFQQQVGTKIKTWWIFKSISFEKNKLISYKQGANITLT